MIRSAVLLIALASASCVRSGQGFIKDSQAVVTIGGGTASLGGGNAWRVWYFVDRTSQTCWMEIGQIGGQVECCKVRKVKEAVPYISWETDASCQQDGEALVLGALGLRPKRVEGEEGRDSAARSAAEHAPGDMAAE